LVGATGLELLGDSHRVLLVRLSVLPRKIDVRSIGLELYEAVLGKPCRQPPQ
jgi:hypothetical protein